jgi:hypothetical protein
MIRLQEPELKPTDDHSAWQEMWNDDERMLAITPVGYWYDLVNVSMIKRILQWELPPDYRLSFLEHLHKLVRGHLTLEAMQAVAPACDLAMKMIDEMKALSIDDKCRLMRKWNVLAAFVNLNPSIVEALKLFGFPTQQTRSA